MESIGERLIWHYVPFTDIPIPLGGINVLTVFNTLAVMFMLWFFMWLGVRKITRVPGRIQFMLEQFVDFLSPKQVCIKKKHAGKLLERPSSELVEHILESTIRRPPTHKK